jgi:hypothetical protein
MLGSVASTTAGGSHMVNAAARGCVQRVVWGGAGLLSLTVTFYAS